MPVTGFIYRLLPDWQRVPFGGQVIDARYLARLAIVTGVMAVPHVRYRRDPKQQQAIEQELAAARMLQEALLSARRQRVSAPTFRIHRGCRVLTASEARNGFHSHIYSAHYIHVRDQVRTRVTVRRVDA